MGDGVSVDQIKRMDKEGKLKRNLINPPLKDTVTIPAGGYTVIRFYAENPGFWLLHCHLEVFFVASFIFISNLIIIIILKLKKKTLKSKVSLGERNDGRVES